MQVTYSFHKFQCPGQPGWYNKMLNWLQQFSIFCVLDHCGYTGSQHGFPRMAAAGALQTFEAEPGNAFSTLEAAANTHQWLFGHIGYDCKNEVERLDSSLPGHTGFPGFFLFQPEIILILEAETVQIASVIKPAAEIWNEIMAAVTTSHKKVTSGYLHLNSRFTKEEYTQTVNRLKEHIHRGDCYEINFCQEFFAEEALIDPLAAYLSLTAASPNPFSGFYRVRNSYLICASPERFLQKKGTALISQPIKGTWKRSCENDNEERNALQRDAKERSENIMVADLVRNDLSKICTSGSVTVTELCGAYTFPQVHHLVSTITGTVEPGTAITPIMKALFPMGSMTGAPKKKVMELVEQYEKTKRGIFSGALGFITPNGDFDFNVVIRSMMYNTANNYLSYLAGSGITFYCDAEKEYEECLLKAQAIEKVLRGH